VDWPAPFVDLPVPFAPAPPPDPAPAPPDAAPAPVRDTAVHTLSALLAEPGVAPASAPSDDLPLVAAISGLTRTSSTSSIPPDRRVLTLFAAVLLALDAAALAALNRRRPLRPALSSALSRYR
jgi:hypothetical protein